MTGNIFLVGLMGAGKTTVGKLIARHFSRPFVDSDHEIEKRTGVNIPLIFELEGEAGFRIRETAVIEELTRQNNIVLATGGGAILSQRNRDNLRNNGTVIYLRAKVEDLWQRTRHDKNRPLLQTSDPQAKMKELFVQRDPLYSEIADIIVDTGSQSVHALVHQIEERLKQLNPGASKTD
ncbi:shikimate kinase [Sulfuricella denitrificans skB26]|uniref:Shikimate kinase n=1 Tax=Sulfuricella denitrificans (strain DSM 22764 / NBRC 105220 / skB26) TaxID=1163617 RepID=S6ABH2_SULDS|nr:shikimate kinase AroK [Sulfuricella denitrificans]BAN36745.1 shikimate kinase [Sulfuricella denitrificans skB26]